MSHVFLATELRFGRDVVIKVLHEDIAGALSAERFEREIQVAARLQHPHIVPLLTAGDAGELLYYTMPFVRGETLRDRLVRDGRLQIAEAVRIAREVADALACAHRSGVVHRDIKPENVFLSGGHAVVGDFGIARAISASNTRTNENAGLTQVGTSLGTPAYMSPEQAAGESEIDGRSDIYSLGCMLYEMLAGRQPFTGPSVAAVIAKRFMETPSPLRTIDGVIPLALEQVVSCALAREPGDRYATAELLLEALASIGTARVSSPDETPSVAVLPFTNTSGNIDDEYFSDGMTEEVINALAQLPGLRVAARTSSFAFKGARADLRTIAEQLGVKSILEGGVRRVGNKVRISAQLIGAADGLHLWSERYDDDLSDVFALQDRIAQSIANALRQKLQTRDRDGSITGGRPLMLERSPVNPAAYDAYLRGRFLFEQHRALEALASFERAAEIDPTFARARAWIALTNTLAANLAMLPALVAYPRARAAADHALSLDPDLAEARLSRCVVALWFDWERGRAEALARDLVAVAPEMPHAHELLGWSISVTTRVEEGLASMAHAYALDPLSDFMLCNFAMHLILVGKATCAVEELERGLVRSPENASTHALKGFALFAVGHFTQANAAFERSRDLAPQRHFSARHACVLAEVGRADEARAMVADAELRAASGAGSPFDIGCAHHWLGDDTSAFEWLERSFQAREFLLIWMHLDPRLRRLHGDPRFESLIRRVGIANYDVGANDYSLRLLY